MNKEYAVLFMVKAQELPKDYKLIIEDCKKKVTEYFGTRNISEDNEKAPGIHVTSDINKEDAEELRAIIPNYVELAFIERVGDQFIVVDL